MGKIKILVVPSDRAGVSFYRSVEPHLKLEELYPEEFHIDIDYEPDLNNENFLKEYQIIHFHRTLGSFENFENLIKKLRKLNIISILDIDDYWEVDRTHPLYPLIKKDKIPEKIINNIKLSDYITTTTDIFKNEILKYNKNVFVIPNSIDPNDKQFIPKKIECDKIRIGWAGGSSHENDISNLQPFFNKISTNKDILNKIKIVLIGFDLRGKITVIDRNTNKRHTRDIMPKETVWYRYEKIFTNNYSIVSDNYKQFLLLFENKQYENVKNEHYIRIWSKPIKSYGNSYNYLDISLAPLANNIFNKMKSELKVIESGFHKKVLIAQKLGIYEKILTNGINKNNKFNDKGNALLVDINKNHKLWFKYLKLLLDNPSFMEVLSNNLYEFVRENYDLNKITNKRRDIYKNLIYERNKY